MRTTLMTSVAAVALMTGAAIADSHDKTDAEVKSETSANLEAEGTTSGAEELANDIEQAGEDAANAAEDVAGDIAEGADAAADATADAAEDAYDATADAANDAANAAENTAEDVSDTTEQALDDMSQDDEMISDTSLEANPVTSDENDVTSNASAVDGEWSGMVVGDILGMNVVTQDGEIVGEIDYVVRQNDGLAGVIGIGGFLGLGEYTVAIPLDEFSMAAGDEGLKLSSWTETELEAQPEFDETGVEGLDADVSLSDAS